MTDTGWIALATTILTVILIPLLVVVIRGAIKWTRAEDRLESMADDLKDLRQATDRRLRWLEENLWRRQRPRRDPPPPS